jgi:hypothetical protein
MKTMKTISLIAATFLTAALMSSAVEAGRIPISGNIAGSESYAPFPDPAQGFYVNGSVTSTDTQLGPFTEFYTAPLVFAFPEDDTGASRLIVGDAANGDSILTCLIGNNPDLCANGDLHIVELATIMGGTGRYAGARGAFTVDRCVNFATGETSGTISGTLIVRGNP